MKKLLTISILLFTLMFSSTSYAEWTKFVKTFNGDIIYIDFDRVRKVDGYVYWWHLSDYLKPDQFGTFSSKVYTQGDCKLFRFKYLSFSFFKEPMGVGAGKVDNKPDKEWNYPPPNSTQEIILKLACLYAKNNL